MTVTEDDAYRLLSRIGALRCYRGSSCAAVAATLAANEPERLQLITKLLYPDVARHLGIRPHCVERNIRTVINYVWSNRTDAITDVLGTDLDARPNASQFISLLSSALCRGTGASQADVACNQ